MIVVKGGARTVWTELERAWFIFGVVVKIKGHDVVYNGGVARSLEKQKL